MGKFSDEKDGCHQVVEGSFGLVSKVSQPMFFTIVTYPRPPFLLALVPRYAVEARCVASYPALVRVVLRVGSDSKIAAAIVQGIEIDVIALPLITVTQI